jgi:transcriptional regulator with XRE-family HTH domain
VEEREEARRLRREQGLPMKVIARRLGVSPSSVLSWTRDIEILPEHAARNMERSRTSFSLTWAEKHRERRRQMQEEGRRRARAKDPLHLAGCLIYWAEGTKDRNVLCLANSDVNMVRMFLRFLRECFGVEDDALTVRLNVYTGNGLSIEQIEDYWLDELDLPRSCLRGHTLNHRPTSSSGKKLNRLPYGVCQLRVRKSTDLVQHIYGAIQEYGGFDEPRWLDGPPRKPQPRPERRSTLAT